MLTSSACFGPRCLRHTLRDMQVHRGIAMTGRTLEERVSTLENAVVSLQTLPGEIAAFRRDVNARFEQIDARFEQIDARFERVDAQFHQMEDRFDRVERRVSDDIEHLYARMRMLHEELIDRIKIGREGPDSGESDVPRRPRQRPKR